MADGSFRDLEAWQAGMQLVELVYRSTRNYPDSELYGLTAQTNRSAVSIPSNLAEGWGRKKTGEFAYHTRVARGSLAELETQLILGQRLRLLPIESFEETLVQAAKTGQLVNGLLRYLESGPIRT